jgi:hypothetical protein
MAWKGQSKKVKALYPKDDASPGLVPEPKPTKPTKQIKWQESLELRDAQPSALVHNLRDHLGLGRRKLGLAVEPPQAHASLVRLVWRALQQLTPLAPPRLFQRGQGLLQG